MAPGERHLMLDVITMKLRRRERLMSVLGLALDGGRLDGVVLRRTNGAICGTRWPSAASNTI